MRKICLLFLLLFLTFHAFSQQRPNIILIIADDLGSDDLGAYGHPNIKTPNIDRLAREGMRFDNAYLTTSSCSPSRASIITGTYPHQTDAEQLHWPVPASKTTFVEKLRASGYWTAQAGKWHLGDALTDRFDYLAVETTDNLKVNAGAAVLSKPDGSGAHNWVHTLRSRPDDKPFFLWLAAVDPHRPYKENTPGYHQAADVLLPPYFPDRPEVRQDFVDYYNEITRLDKYVGDIMEELEAQGLEENTILVFMSDNGRAFPREKTTLYRQGVRTPLIVKWPRQIKPGTVSRSLLSSIDLAPTFLTLAAVRPDKHLEGKDFSVLFRDPSRTIRDYVYAEDNWHDYEDYGRSVRNVRFSYIRNYYHELPETAPADAFLGKAYQEMLKMHAEGGLKDSLMTFFAKPKPEEQLFDVEKDPFELRNLINDPEYASIARTMRRELQKFRKKTRDVIPAVRTPDEFDRSTGMPLPNRRMPRPGKFSQKQN